MPKFKFDVSQAVYYDVFVTAETREEAAKKLQEMIDGDDEDDLDLYERDNGSFVIENEEENANG